MLSYSANLFQFSSLNNDIIIHRLTRMIYDDNLAKSKTYLAKLASNNRTFFNVILIIFKCIQ